MTKTQFGEAGRRAELRKALAGAKDYLTRESRMYDGEEKFFRLPLEQRAKVLLAIMLRELGLDYCDKLENEFQPFLAENLLEDVEVAPRTLHQAVKALRAQRALERKCSQCGAPKEQKAA